MTEQELRQLVRDAIARVGPAAPGGRSLPDPALAHAGRGHAAFTLMNLPAGADSDGPCIIEPAVSCNHCGYCKSYGH